MRDHVVCSERPFGRIPEENPDQKKEFLILVLTVFILKNSVQKLTRHLKAQHVIPYSRKKRPKPVLAYGLPTEGNTFEGSQYLLA